MLHSKFDNILRSKERKYMHDHIFKVGKANTNNPRDFWQYINSLSRSKTRAIREVVDLDGELNSYIDTVLN